MLIEVLKRAPESPELIAICIANFNALNTMLNVNPLMFFNLTVVGET